MSTSPRSPVPHASRPSFTIIALLALLLPGVATAGDWPQFRGPDGTGISQETELAGSWPEEGPPEAWRRAIGDGFAGMSVVGDRLYTIEVRDAEQRVIAVDTATGTTVWSAGFGSDYPDQNGFGNGARSTPTVDGDRLFATSADAVLLALAKDDGRQLWRVDFTEAFGAEAPRFGYATSPFVVGDTVVAEVGGPEGHSLVAFDKGSGEVVWASLDDPASYGTPIRVSAGGRDQLVFNRRSGLIGIAAETGEVLWSHPSAPDTIVMPTFVPPDSFFISAAAMGDGGHLIKLVTGETEWTTEVVWSNHRFRNHFNTSVLLDGHLYGFDNATFRCVDAETGENVWAHRGYGKGSLVAADGLLFVLSDKGLLALVEASPAGFRELGRVQATEGRAWTSPTLGHGRLFVRDHDELVAYDVRASASGGRSVVAEAPATSTTAAAAPPATAEELAAAYAEARGGLERWREVHSLELTGRYSAFSTESDFLESRQRTEEGDRFRIDFQGLRGTITFARDDGGPWWIFPTFGITEPARLAEPPAAAYAPQIDRRARLEPPLLGWKEKGVELELLGPESIGERQALAVKLTLPSEQVETWYLDPETGLEIAVDAQIHDFTQMGEPLTQRTFFSDFRTVDGLVLPHRFEMEFGARLEEMNVVKVRVNPEIDPAVFEFVPTEVEEAEAEADGDSDAETEDEVADDGP